MDLSLQQWLALVVGYGTLPALVVLVAVLAVTATGVGLARPHWLVLLYLVPFFFFPMSTYGALVSERVIWSRGGGQLYLPFVVWFLGGAFLVVWFSNQFSGLAVRTTAVHRWFLAWSALFVAHLMLAAVLDRSVLAAADSKGVREFVLAGLLFALLLRAFNDAKSVALLFRAFMVFAVLRGLYGLGRFVFLGGDPANVYSNFGGLNVKLTFFDINDSLLAAMAGFMAAWALIARWREQTLLARATLGAVVLLELAVILFSYRRTAWGGLVLVVALGLMFMPIRQRVVAMVIGLPPLLVALYFVATRRLGQHGTSVAGFFSDFGQQGSTVPMTDRAYELVLSWRTFLENPFFGVGTWGGYDGGLAQISWHRGEHAFSFLHSGVLHVMVKTGLVGLALLVGLASAFLLWALRHRDEVAPRWKGPYMAGVAGFLFMLPSWLLGTPSIEFRTMQLLALCLAIPYVALRASAAPAARR